MKFVIATANASQEQQDRITEYLKATGGWWHWFPNMWLFYTHNAALNVRTIRDAIGELDPDIKPLLVFRVGDGIADGYNWAGRGLPKAARNSVDWLNSNWNV